MKIDVYTDSNKQETYEQDELKEKILINSPE